MFTATLDDVCQLVVVEEVASVVRRIVVEADTPEWRWGVLTQTSAFGKTSWGVRLEWSNASGADVLTVDRF